MTPRPGRANGIYEFLRDDEDNINANGDYTTTPKTMFIPAQSGPQGKNMSITSLIVTLEFAGRPRRDEGYGSIAKELTNGILFRLNKPVNPNAGVKQDFLDGERIKRHLDWGRYTFNLRETPSSVHACWTFDKGIIPAIGAPRSSLVLGNNSNRQLEVVLNDNFKDLKGHFFQVQGEEFSVI